MVTRGIAGRGTRWATALVLVSSTALAQPFQLPTANHTLFEPGHEEQFFVGTVGKAWGSGCFGCVRSDGWQMHEGLDIRCLQRDKRGEPTDPVMAAADGTVVYINAKPSLSNYGNYIVLRHRVENLELYSIYAHLSAIAPSLKPGQPVKTGETDRHHGPDVEHSRRDFQGTRSCPFRIEFPRERPVCPMVQEILTRPAQ